MEAQFQEITMTIYPDAMEVKKWTLQACVFGDWVVHKTHPNYEDFVGDYDWSVSHFPTGALAFVTNEFDQAIEAASRLSCLESPQVAVEWQDDHFQFVPSLSFDWAERATKVLLDLRVFTGNGNSPKKLLQLIERKRVAA